MNNGPEWMDEERSGAQANSGLEAARAAEIAAADEELLALEPELMLLERDLRAALQPVDLPAGFADRVIAAAESARAKARTGTKVLPFGRRVHASLQMWRLAAGGAIAATVLAGTFVMDEIHQRHERERVQMTEQQLEKAVQVSNRALDEARAQLQRAAYRINK